ncbi:cadmium-induced protein AS8 isoform X2 [Punica granatum]|uniref:Cadmium-induced protein AS8 isoform X2 n=3 Tax=Punica granatum TaxID=22663 RepID=A0A6P8BPP5_PUNGR|nr:cadmium-induced protein AS8 isoform X2 [Punica granatum]
MVGMIIKGLLRRYERWNPVHPTIGAFWGMGFGFGCGVGWGPGLGPEVIGYVGAGCGVGFSVGFTMAGVGIGLPANYLFEVPYNVVKATRSAVEFGWSGGFLSWKSIPVGRWNLIAPHVSLLHAEASRKLSNFKQQNFLSTRANLFVPLQSESAWKSLQTFSSHRFQPREGPRG